MRPPLVTVIVAGRDIAPLVPAALDSLLAQTDARWRAVLVDDGSVDGTGDEFARYAAQDPRFTVITHDVSRGLGAARNAALATVDTPYVTFFDADDVMRPDALATMFASLEASGSELAVGAYVRLRLVDGAWTSGEVQPWAAASVTPARRGITLDDHPDVVGNIVAWSKVSATSLWRRLELRFPEGVLYEDQEVSARLYAAARGIDLVDAVLVEWRIRADGTSITQGEADPAVLSDCVRQMRAGLDVLAAHSPLAAARRTTQILRMDVPRLAGVATGEGRDLLAAFTRTLNPTADDLTLRTQSPANPDDPNAPLVGEVYERVLGW